MALRLIKPELVSLIYLTVGGIGPGIVIKYGKTGSAALS
jgi:hypothetical protein